MESLNKEQLLLLDWFFVLLHGGLTVFNMIGWLIPSLRKFHFFVITGTLLSWILIGWMVGNIGYCPLTDWHWDVKRLLGETGLPGSFIKYYADKLLSYSFNATMIDVLTAIVGIVAFLGSLYFRLKK